MEKNKITTNIWQVSQNNCKISQSLNWKPHNDEAHIAGDDGVMDTKIQLCKLSRVMRILQHCIYFAFDPVVLLFRNRKLLLATAKLFAYFCKITQLVCKILQKCVLFFSPISPSPLGGSILYCINWTNWCCWPSAICYFYDLFIYYYCYYY